MGFFFRFGFVETLTREKEIFFHFSNIEGKADKLEVGMEVEYTIFNREKGGKVSAEGVKVLTKGSIAPLKAKEEVMNGKVVRPLRSVNPDQDEYCGLIQVKSEEGAGKKIIVFSLVASSLNYFLLSSDGRVRVRHRQLVEQEGIASSR